GVYNPKHDGQTDALELDLWVGRTADIEVVGNLDSDPRFLEPLSAIEELSPFMTARNDEAHIVGVVHAYRPGRITVRDHSGQVVIQTLQRLPVQIGEVIEAVGMRFTGGADWLLRDALVRQAPKALADELRERMSQPAPVIRLAEQILELTPEDAATGHPVELVGVVIRSLPGSGTLYLRDTSGCVRVDIRAA